MKKKRKVSSLDEMAAINAKCDVILELLNSVLESPDFLIERLRHSVGIRHCVRREAKMEIVRCHDFK